MIVEQRTAEEKVKRLQGQINQTQDRRAIRRLEGQLDAALVTASTLKAQIAEQAEIEAEAWGELWSTPQAAMWKAHSCPTREVALYVRHQLAAEAGDLRAAAHALARSDRLGLTPLALAKLGWEIVPTGEGEVRGVDPRQAVEKVRAKTAAPPRADPREIFRAV